MSIGTANGDRVVGVGLAHRPLRDDHELVRDDGARRVRLRPADDDAVLGAIDHPEVQVRVVLVRRAPAAIALHVGDGGGRHHLLALEALHVVEHARVVVGSPIARPAGATTTRSACSSSRPMLA